MLYLTPNTLGGLITRPLYIPSEFLPIVSGQLSELLADWIWEPYGDLTIADCVAVARDILEGYYGGNPLIGTIQAYVTTSLPDNVLPCDGSTHALSDYPALLGKLSPAIDNGDGTFTTPDLANFFIRGGESGEIGDTGGADSVALTAEQNGEHDHTIQQGYGPNVAASVVLGALSGFQAVPTQETTSTSGSGTPHENRPPYYSVVFGLVVA